jgi:hypothetical protein
MRRDEFDATPVATRTVTLPVLFAATVSLAGLKLQAALLGREPQLKVKVPEEPLEGLRASVNRAVCPLETVMVELPEGVAAKSNPIPERVASVGAARAPLDTARFPLCGPAAAGEKEIAATQLAAGESVAVQVVLAN